MKKFVFLFSLITIITSFTCAYALSIDEIEKAKQDGFRLATNVTDPFLRDQIKAVLKQEIGRSDVKDQGTHFDYYRVVLEAFDQEYTKANNIKTKPIPGGGIR